uniref:Uncharacterized protein n=1 Tax=Solanum tuberosum TaxID=4113 RepID=M1DJC3_SOLTU
MFWEFVGAARPRCAMKAGALRLQVPIACSYIPCTDAIWPTSLMMQTRVINRRSVDTICSARVALIMPLRRAIRDHPASRNVNC